MRPPGGAFHWPRLDEFNWALDYFDAMAEGTAARRCGSSTKMAMRSNLALQRFRSAPMKKQRKHYTPEEKVAILRRHLLEQVPILELCDKQGLQPTVFYRWQKEFFENGAAAFQPKA